MFFKIICRFEDIRVYRTKMKVGQVDIFILNFFPN